MSPPTTHESPAAPRIVDAVFGAVRPVRPSLTWVALALAMIGHGVVVGWATGSQKSLESWSAELAVRVHARLSREEIVELSKPPVPPPPPPPAAAEPPPPAPPPRAAAPVARERAQPATPPPPAQAGAVVTADQSAPVDLTGDTFVTGSASAYAGGVTTASGTSTTAVHTLEVARLAIPAAAPRAREPDQSSAVQLEEQAWNCPWPHEADDESIDEQLIVLRVVVRADGSVESARVVGDPGKGFGQAATACALQTHFAAARDAHGQAIRAQSPPIRVRFTR